MPVIGVLTLEIHVEYSHSLKDKRQVVKSLKDRLREHFNVSVAEIDGLDSWQSSVIAVVTVANDRVFAEKVLQGAETHAADLLGGSLAASGVEWL
ncbi:MAG: DUF503 domain-containing protein [Acidobacteriaceae bacterium]|nr:DUF503 domain-containing protein [Acidobacteriaceae bacterium]MBV9036058.1 DUF503 domain-containing protein [Acidobacteriaceae bacterium]MBV9226776.1 DUF503 domain-containing protein [Acidobacteriaceae bacterium]MBV9307255.1 DUF503 domain-containing protein [Acidobacteriaceae bacterium]